MSGLFISATGILNAIRRQDVTANNIANSATTGFRASRVDSVDLPSGGASTGAIRRDPSAGSFVPTGVPSDLSSARGFFQVRRPDGTLAFTLDGRFSLNADGDIVTSDGSRLEPPIQAPPGATITVSRDGTVFATAPGAAQPEAIGQIQVVQFANPDGLESLGGNLFAVTANSGDPVAVPAPGIESGALQGSNVNLANELVNTIVNRNTFQANAAAFRAQSDIVGELFDRSE